MVGEGEEEEKKGVVLLALQQKKSKSVGGLCLRICGHHWLHHDPHCLSVLPVSRLCKGKLQL